MCFANPATSPTVEFSGTAGRVVPAGSLLNRADGYQYRLDHGVTIGVGGTATVSITVVLPSVLDDSSVVVLRGMQMQERR